MKPSVSSSLLAVFDLDGTLNRIDLFSVPAHQKALAEFGSPLHTRDAAYISATFGMRADDYVPLLLPGADEETKLRYLDRVRILEQQNIVTMGAAFDGVAGMLCEIRSRGIRTAVCSNASSRYIHMVLDVLKLTDQIDYTQELVPDMTKDDTLRLLLHRVRPSRAVMIGDTILDIQAARANGLPSIGCLYGYRPEQAAKADVTVSRPCEIPGQVFSLLQMDAAVCG
ncbi:MAG: HAD family hydrolase [Clostridiales bacterium]|nr:HAD family hydrolase [Clostridiales bacterium]